MCDVLVLFVIFKLFGVVSWPWGWVLLPLWLEIFIEIAKNKKES